MKTTLRILAHPRDPGGGRSGRVLVPASLATACRGHTGFSALTAETSGGQIRVSGNIETTEVQIAFKIPGRVERAAVRRRPDGQAGRRWWPCWIRPIFSATWPCARRKCKPPRPRWPSCWPARGRRTSTSAEAAWKKAAHALADLEAGSRPQEIAAAEAAVAAAAADMERLQADYAGPRRCSSGRRSRPRSSTPPEPPTTWPSRDIARPSSN